jgi:hypothetical protein
MWYTLLHLPVVDCLPYQPGTNMLSAMKPPPGSIPDSTVITFEYEKGGKKVEFTADNFPEDFNDSLYTNPRRYDKVVRKGNADPAIRDFSLTNRDGQNITDSVLSAPGSKLLLFLRHKYNSGDWMIVADAIFKDAAKKGIPAAVVTSISSAEPGKIPFSNQLPVFACDATAIKTAARANPTLFLLNGDKVISKWSYADFDKAAASIRNLAK